MLSALAPTVRPSVDPFRSYLVRVRVRAARVRVRVRVRVSWA